MYHHQKQLRTIDGTSKPKISITNYEVKKAIDGLKNKKASDEWGLSSEHFKLGSFPVFNTILETGYIPAIFKIGVITPVHKKNKDPKSLNNYRGITVSSTIGKIFDIVMLTHEDAIVKQKQNTSQSGFTQNASPNHASLVITECILDSKQKKR